MSELFADLAVWLVLMSELDKLRKDLAMLSRSDSSKEILW